MEKDEGKPPKELIPKGPKPQVYLFVSVTLIFARRYEFCQVDGYDTSFRDSKKRRQLLKCLALGGTVGPILFTIIAIIGVFL